MFNSTLTQFQTSTTMPRSSVSGSKVFSRCDESFTHTENIHKSKLTLRFSDIFSARNEKEVWVVPYYPGEGLMGLIENRGYMIRPEERVQRTPVRCSSTRMDIEGFILVNYELYSRDEWDSLFREVSKLVFEGETLTIPPFGLYNYRNLISYGESSRDMIFSLKSWLEDEEKSFSVSLSMKFREDDDSYRFMMHAKNWLSIVSKCEFKCAVCMENPPGILRDCGHRVVCERCGPKVDKCPLCRNQGRTYFCERIDDKNLFPCCHLGREKVKTIHLPCCHYRAGCEDCTVFNRIQKTCPVCLASGDNGERIEIELFHN